MVTRADAPFGLRPIRRSDGSPWNGATTPYYVTGDNNALYIGDCVNLAGSANTAAVSAIGVGDMPAGSLPTVVRATAGATNEILGVVVGVAASDRDSTTYRANDTDRVVYVCDDDDVVFLAQADAAVPATSVGLNTNLLHTVAGSTVSGISGAEVDATAAADATYQFTIVRAHPRADNPYNAAGNVVEVMINLHARRAGQAGV